MDQFTDQSQSEAKPTLSDELLTEATQPETDSPSPTTDVKSEFGDFAEDIGDQNSSSGPIGNEISMNEDITSDEEVPDEEDDDDDDDDDSKDESMDSDSDIPLDDIDNMLEEGIETTPTAIDGKRRKRKLDEMRLKLSTPHEERKKIVLKSM